MFSNPLLIVLIMLAAALPAVATASLMLTMAGPGAVDGVEDLKVITTLTNTGDKTVKLLNHPSSVLGTLPADTFIITNDAGATPDFIGVRFKYSPTQAATSTDPSSVTVIAPGKSVSFTHDLSAAYNFTDTGYGTYTIEPSKLLHVVGPGNEISEIRAHHVEPFTADIVSGKLAVALPSFTTHATFIGCSHEQQADLNISIAEAKSYVDAALVHLSANHNATTRYTTWFGSYTSARHDTVLDHFYKISRNPFADFKYNCACTMDVFAYVYPDDFGKITICRKFWHAPQTGTDSKAGTLVHEASHFAANGYTHDIVYGQVEARNLALSFPNGAIFSADNHEYFAENTPAESAVPTPVEQMYLVLQDTAAGPVQY